MLFPIPIPFRRFEKLVTKRPIYKLEGEEFIMKRKLLTVILCSVVILAIASSLFLIVGGIEGDANSPEDLPFITERSIFPDSTLAWQSYTDYIVAQGKTAYENPQTYVGYEVAFLPCWDSLFCRAGFGAGYTENYVRLYSEMEGDEPLFNGVNVDDLRLVITDYHVDENKDLWYKIAAPEGYTLPEVFETSPYILHIENYVYEEDLLEYTPPTFCVKPQKAIFLPGTEKVVLRESIDENSPTIEVEVSDLAQLFDVVGVFEYGPYGDYLWTYYDLGNLASEYTTYRYVSPESIVLIPAEASIAYEKLLASEDSYEYYETLSDIPTEVQEKFSDVHRAELDDCIEALTMLEQTEYETTVNVNGVEIPVTVTGNIPSNVTLTAEAVTYDDIIAEGFDINNTVKHVIGLDIKLINPDDTVWQPKEGRRIAVSIGVGAIGYQEGDVLSLQHKHGENIEKFNIAVVQNGAVTVAVSGFSIFEVLEPESKTQATGITINTNSTIELKVGDNKIYYRTGVNNTTGTTNLGTWEVVDRSGAIHYVVYSQTDLGHSGMYVPWIELDALKETPNADTRVNLIFHYRNNNNYTKENYTLNIVTPKADKGGKELYLKDDVNNSGSIIATLVDENGNEIEHGLDGASFSWKRSDGLFIIPQAYGEGYRSVNIARDHGGLVEARRDPDTKEFMPITYRVDVVFADSTTDWAEYTVYYQSEIVNANFELPKTPNNMTYTYFPNGWPDLYWATTSPGSSRTDDNYKFISMDIEYGTPFGNDTGWGITEAAEGTQFAEINCENFGALYQDIITAPGEDIEWEFAHAPRQNQSWSGSISNAMFIVIGATETAQELDQDDLLALGQSALAVGKNNNAFMTCKEPVVVKYPNNSSDEYYVWYHDAGEQKEGRYTGTWTQLEGSYTVPEGQYRTRLFFVSRPYNDNPKSGSLNAGNLIDNTKGGQYKKYLIEYYEQTYVDGKLTISHMSKYDEIGEALIYSSEKLDNFYDEIVVGQGDYLHHVDINGNSYPYDLRYKETDPNNAYLYIQKYEGTPVYGIEGQTRDYSDYDIVMQLYFRDTVVAVQKQLRFPTGLSEEQKNDLMKYFEGLTPAGYKTQFELSSVGDSYAYSQIKSTYITQRDPSGNYKAYVALGDNPELEHYYQVEETDITEIPGLKLSSVIFQVQLYESGQKYEDVKLSDYYESELTANDPLLSPQFKLEGNVKIADVVVINTYEEIETVIVYHGVGNGKIKINKDGSVFEDAPTESIAFYSELADGCQTHAGAGATFVGWFKDPECTDPVTSVDGVWDKNTGIFIPNANIISSSEIHFYAKFETGSITIERENANPGQTFVYHVTSTDGAVDMYVPLECDENGIGRKVILEVPLNKTYVITEHDDWSWRHTGNTITKKNADNEEERHLLYEFKSNIKFEWWLNGYSQAVENIFGKNTTG